MIILPPQRNPRMKTLILDLDETLVHCNENVVERADFYLSLSISFGYTIKAGVLIRPFMKEFLTRMAKYFEIIVFTASHRVLYPV
jgi:CTD small phosphatase-like protein 2